MTRDDPSLDTIFAGAIEIASGEERTAFVARACGTDEELRRRVERLVDAHFQAGSFLESPPASPPTSSIAPALSTEPVGTVIGPYKLIQVIGEGGMGTVYMAEQTDPVRRTVALKLIKTGMDSRQVLARFSAERQALALMDHPNIAKVFDAGTTETGRPYFVMELVKGIPITRFCDERRLTLRERLELAIPVCQAVQHAHQKGIIHRDLKPSNVLIALFDGKPVPKVIDFGVAKATGPRLTDQTLYTEFGAVVGTLEYMSPEQAELNQLDIDTRSDIYSLGVLLYELLTGSTPLEHRRLKSVLFLEVLRLIREEESPRPSMRLSTTEELPSIAACRHVEPRKLSGLVRGELDWIVMKALEKDRNRRYETANDLAADLRRYLDDEPVQACPPSVGYRLRKFARRNKKALAAASLLAVALLVAVGGITGGIGWALRDRAYRQAEVTRQVALILDEVDRLEREQKWPEALDLARRANAVLAGGDGDRASQARARQTVADLEMVARLEEVRLQGSELPVEPGGRLATRETALRYEEAFRDYGVDVEALPAAEATARLRSRGSIAAPLAEALDDWWRQTEAAQSQLRGRLLTVASAIDSDPWRSRLRAAVAAKDDEALGRLAAAEDTERQPPQSLVSLAWALKKPEQGIRLLQHACERYPGDFWTRFVLSGLLVNSDPESALRHADVTRALRPKSPVAWSNLGVRLGSLGKLDQASATYRRAIEIDPNYSMAYFNLGTVLERQGRPDEAIAEYRMAIALDPKLAMAHNNLGIALRDQRKQDEAIAEYRMAIAHDPKLAVAHSNLGSALRDQRKLDEAIAEYRKALALDPRDAMVHGALGEVLREQGKLDEAITECLKAVELDPTLSETHGSLGNALYVQGKLGEAIVEFRKAIELDPKGAKAHVSLGFALRNQGKLGEAITEYRKAIELDPKLALAHLNLGFALRQQGKLDEAIAEFRKTIVLDPRYARLHGTVGDVLREQGKLDEAIAEWRMAISLDPNFSAAHCNLGHALRVQGKLDEAIAELRKAITLDPKSAVCHLNLGLALCDQGKLNEAIAEYREAIKLDPTSVVAHNSLSWLLANCPDATSRDPVQAVDLARKAVQLAPKQGAHWNTLGVAQYRAGDWKAAIEALTKSMELLHGESEGFNTFFLAMSHWQLSDKPQALSWYAKAISWMEKNQPKNEELIRFRDEAAALLEVKATKD
jgi:tetratricopeptide (TPR) repeat protein